MSSRRLVSFTAIALAAAAALPSPAVAQAPVTVRVGYFSQLHDAAVLDLASGELAGKAKFEYVKFQRYADAAIALVRGDIDISSLGYANVITEAAKGGEPKFKFVTGLARGAINLVCNNNVKVAAWPDLKGRTVGVVSGFPEIFLDDALRTHGQKESDVKKVNFAVAGPPVLQALQDGTTECASVFEPFGATAVSNGYAYYPPTDIGDNSFKGLNNGIAANAEFLAKNATVVRDIVTTANKSTAKFRDDENRWADFISRSQGFSEAIVKVGVKRVKLDSRLYPGEALTLAGKMKSLGLIKEQPSEAQLQRFFVQP